MILIWESGKTSVGCLSRGVFGHNNQIISTQEMRLQKSYATNELRENGSAILTDLSNYHNTLKAQEQLYQQINIWVAAHSVLSKRESN